MSKQDQLSRRRFLQLTATGVGSIYLLSRCSEPFSKWRFFTNAEARLMDALADQIIPPDEWPGGRESGITNYIDSQLLGPYVRFQEDYRRGLLAIQDSCYTIYNRKFEDLKWEEQTALLEALEGGNLKGESWKDGFDKTVFALIRDHSMQGYYGSPRHGGNKNNVSYKMLRLDYPLIIGQNRYKS